MHSKKQGTSRTGLLFLRCGQLKLAYGRKITHLSIFRFLFVCLFVCLFVFKYVHSYVFFHFHVISAWSWNILTTKNSAFSAACHIPNYRKVADFSKSHFQRNRYGLIPVYTNCHILKGRRNMNLNLIFLQTYKKTHFTQNVTCPLFCGSASHLRLVN